MNEVSVCLRVTYSMNLTVHIAWISYLNIAVLIATLALALFNASKDQIARDFAYTYAAISVGVLVRTCWDKSH